MSLISFADAVQAGKRKKTRREVFLAELELVVPWKALLKVIEPHYSVAGRGRRPYPLQATLKAHIGVDADSGLVHTVTTTGPTRQTWNRWAICCTTKRKLCGRTRAIAEHRVE